MACVMQFETRSSFSAVKITVLSVLLAAGTTLCAEECSQPDILKAQRNGASFDVALRVVDDRGVPVEGARCEGWKWIDAHKDNGSSYETVTDSNGLARDNRREREEVHRFPGRLQFDDRALRRPLKASLQCDAGMGRVR